MKYLYILLIIPVCGCNYVKQSAFDNYKRDMEMQRNTTEMKILVNLDKIETHTYDFDNFKIDIKQDILNLLPTSSFILFVSSRNFQIDIGSKTIITELK